MRKKYVGHRKVMNGYILIKDYNHPNRNSQNDVMEHIKIMSEFLKRPIKGGELIHHINMVRDDNRLENLYLCVNQGQHAKVHSSIHKLVKELLERGILIFKNGEYKLNFSGGD